MKIKNRRLIILLLLFQWCASTYCYSQAEADTAFLTLAKKNVRVLYTAAIQHQSRLYNGSDYVIYLPENEEHPYFQSDDWVDGSVVYWGELYENVPLMYDLQTDQLVTEHNRGNPIKLLAEKIESFSMAGHTFVRLERDSSKIAEGFYDLLYNGETKVYAKYNKTFQETIDNRDITPHFDESTRFYIFNHGVFNVVKKKGSVLQVFEDQKQAVKDFIRKNHVRFKDDRGKSFAHVAAFYDTVNKSK
jgi:hypothetical protein